MEKTTSFSTLSVSPITARDEPGLRRVFVVTDYSMYDDTRHSYGPGDIITGRYIHQHFWYYEISHAPQDFIIIHRQYGAMVRRATGIDIVTCMITLHSFNRMYPDFAVDMNDIDGLYAVIKVNRTI
jgi:hypothetical protein